MTNDVRVPNDDELIVPIAEEHLNLTKLQVDRARVTVRTRVEPVLESIETRLAHEDYSIERVMVGHFVDAPPVERIEGDTRIIPIVEEVAVVVKRLRLVEELRITRRKYTTPFQESVEVRRMRASVERTPLNSTTQPKD